MMDYQTQRRFGKRAKVHVKDDRHVSVHFKNKISVILKYPQILYIKT